MSLCSDCHDTDSCHKTKRLSYESALEIDCLARATNTITPSRIHQERSLLFALCVVRATQDE